MLIIILRVIISPLIVSLILLILIDWTISKACPLGDSIKMGVKNALAIAYPDYSTEIEVVCEPEWNFDMLSAEGRAQLGF